MASTIRFKSGAGWVGPVADGNLRVKWGGPWISPAYVKHKVGDVGTGSWRDSGYRGYPLAPGSIWIHDWNFNAVALGFTGPPAGGAPVAVYEVLQTDSAGNWMSRIEVGGSPWGNFAVGEDGLYQFFVRSKSAAGLYSGWTGPVKARIGHTEQGYYATENRTRGWTSASASGARNCNDPFWHNVPTNVHISGFHWRNLRTPMSSVVSPDNQGHVAIFVSPSGYRGDYGAVHDGRGTVYSGDNWDRAMDSASDGGPWGIVPRGSRWSTTGNGNNMLWCDAFWVSGTETYQVQVYYVTRNYAGNSYW